MKKIIFVIITIIISLIIWIVGFRIMRQSTSAGLTEINQNNLINSAIEIGNINILTKKEQYKYLGKFKITAYCSCSRCSDGWGNITASGKVPQANHTIATSSKFKFGTILKINGKNYVVEDRGGAIKGNKIDIYFNSHQEALNWGIKYLDVYKKMY